MAVTINVTRGVSRPCSAPCEFLDCKILGRGCSWRQDIIHFVSGFAGRGVPDLACSAAVKHSAWNPTAKVMGSNSAILLRMFYVSSLLLIQPCNSGCGRAPVELSLTPCFPAGRARQDNLEPVRCKGHTPARLLVV
jgi:hypothetical protein